MIYIVSIWTKQKKKQKEIIHQLEKKKAQIYQKLNLKITKHLLIKYKKYLFIKTLDTKYPQIRRVRRDGSCFYRSYLFQIFEHIVLNKDKNLHQKIQNIIKQSKDDLIKAQYQEFVLEDFYDNIMEQLANIINYDFSIDNLQNMFNDKSISDYLVMYLRFMTSGYLKNNAILYENFIENGVSIHQFCQTEVDPLDKEADQIPMMALINYLCVPIKIIYLNSNPNNTEPNMIILPEGIDEKDVFVTLLYRPGHYDIAYTN
ncbi:otu ubiquitin aldehyde binding 1, putative [Ichthyophthirius multifiliis]|uniref:ubiquitinyl hydrolase 1 n=1 Tax=Ichthyophthirius multifiliis TaxID=5932 RepID=G0QX07_ICHMU|nr:otu ubiquitin aldehyde binding 1, putative [Ichthyophthirius multifiliis]EGR30255.1 otu ubiquitin aldehyde binding 1, putative [Ichthyophthirius multifiliis]|eukprot:XP_004031851.1 otu ubiquitin aldehyde binding 1, putative [Ichthyophthirius multifiliis]